MIDAAAAQMEASTFEVSEQLFDPHAAAVGAKRQVVGLLSVAINHGSASPSSWQSASDTGP